MKKIIFLFILFLAVMPIGVSASDLLQCNDVTFEINKSGGDGVITKRGENPFMKTYSVEGYSVSILHVVCDNDTYTFYGYAHGSDPINYYDTLLFVMDENGNVLYEEINDYDGNEETTGAVWIDQVLFVIMRVDDLGDRWNDIDPEFDYYIVRTLDMNYNLLETLIIEDEIVWYDTTDDLLLLYYSYQGPVDIGLNQDMSPYYDTNVFDVKSVYDGVMELSFINEGKLNNETVVNGLHIDYPGVYDFEYNDIEYQFIVHPIVENITHLDTYSGSVTPLISNGNYTLNDELYVSGTEIVNPGNYTLVITGINGYQQTIQFTITPQVEGVINGHAYKEPFVITFDGEGYLNNSLVVSPVQIEEDGDYVLRVNGVGGLSDSYQFSFAEEHNTITAQDVIQKIDVFILIVAIVIGVIIIKKK